MSTTYTRSKYNAPALGRNMARQAPPVEAFIHHTADDPAAMTLHNTKVEQVAKVRAIDVQHRNQGWSMIGYHWVVFQRTGSRNEARAFQARPALYVPAAQQDHNTRTLAIVIVGDGRVNPVFQDTLDTISAILGMYKNLQRIGGHGDVYPTECPGPKFRAAIPKLAARRGLRVI